MTLLRNLLVLILTVCLVSCNNNSPKAVATRFLKGVYQLDYESAKKDATDETKKLLDQRFVIFAPNIPDSIKKELRKITIEIKEVKEDKDKALVTYTTSVIQLPQTLHLVKKNNTWLVQWTKEDVEEKSIGRAPSESATVDTASLPGSIDTAKQVAAPDTQKTK